MGTYSVYSKSGQAMGTRTTFEKVINSEIEDKLQGKIEQDPLHSKVAVLQCTGEHSHTGGISKENTIKIIIK